jgi:hypothetical protein
MTLPFDSLVGIGASLLAREAVTFGGLESEGPAVAHQRPRSPLVAAVVIERRHPSQPVQSGG